jgi:hypothetical protein
MLMFILNITVGTLNNILTSYIGNTYTYAGLVIFCTKYCANKLLFSIYSLRIDSYMYSVLTGCDIFFLMFMAVNHRKFIFRFGLLVRYLASFPRMSP